jgi:hypothetical protein
MLTRRVSLRTISALVAVWALAGASRQAGAATLGAMPTAAEAPFVARATAYLTKRYPTPAAAEKAGYVRYTDEDETGAISYENGAWTSADAEHPSQLWYDVKGRLLGADYSLPLSPTPPNLFGIEPSRWQTFHRHIHYSLHGPGGATIYGATGVGKILAAGGNPEHPTAADLVKAGIATSPAEVAFVFEFPAIWDLELWVLPNPSGAFADTNPNVKPVKPAKDM